VSAAVSVGWASARFHETYLGVPERALNVATARASLTYAPSPRIYLRPHVELTHIGDQRLRAALGSPTITTFGLALGVNLNAAPLR
jgi:hypothetical protein